MESKVVADDSVDFRIVTELRALGLEVYAICEEQPSIDDTTVLAIACNLNAILITEDKDFGELVFRLRLPHKGILLIRFEDATTKIQKVAEAIVKYYNEISGSFSVINEKKLRIKE
jgi:predicted nuclease of predicted toxin-antitoxin system